MNNNFMNNNIDDVDNNIDTNLTDSDGYGDIDNNQNTARISTSNDNEASLFAANNLYRKTADNLAFAEAMIDEKPLRTEKTAELERKESEDRTE